MNEILILAFSVTLNENSRTVAIDTHGPECPHTGYSRSITLFSAK